MTTLVQCLQRIPAKVFPAWFAYSLADELRLQSGEEAEWLLASVPKDDSNLNLLLFDVYLEISHRDGHWRQAVQCLTQLKERGIQTPTKFNRKAIEGYTQRGSWPAALLLIGRLCKGRVELATFGPLAASICCDAGQWRQSFALLESLRQEGVHLTAQVYGRVGAAGSDSGKWQLALALFGSPEKGGAPRPSKTGQAGWASTHDGGNVVMNTMAMKACCSSGPWQQAGLVLRALLCCSVEPDLVSHGCLLAGFANAYQWSAALHHLQHLGHGGVAPNVVVAGSLVKACGDGNQWQVAVQLWRKLSRSGLRGNTVLQTSLVQAYAGSRLWEGALALVLEPAAMASLASADQVAIALLSAAAEASGRNSRWDSALVILEDLRARRLQKPLAFRDVIGGCLASASWVFALQLLDSFCRQGLELSDDTYARASSCWFRISQWDPASDVQPERAMHLLHAAQLQKPTSGWELSNRLNFCVDSMLRLRGTRRTLLCYGADATCACHLALPSLNLPMLREMEFESEGLVMAAMCLLRHVYHEQLVTCMQLGHIVSPVLQNPHRKVVPCAVLMSTATSSLAAESGGSCELLWCIAALTWHAGKVEIHVKEESSVCTTSCRGHLSAEPACRDCLLQAIGSTPTLRQPRFTIDGAKKFGELVLFLKGALKLEVLHVYCSDAFEPAPDESLADLRRCFGVGNRLSVSYSGEQAFS
ncbi:unnamed protein product [Polarella glacialis]|uniref:Ubiquitin-like protein ATG12 n=1 Tax=Polarella glacialis TaxID=89957 RepID=A0A813FFP5_POLGL|nr:unnamed protein product [Polarella glacialis]